MAGDLWALSERNPGGGRSTYGAERPPVSLKTPWGAYRTLTPQWKRPRQPRGHKRAPSPQGAGCAPQWGRRGMGRAQRPLRSLIHHKPDNRPETMKGKMRIPLVPCHFLWTCPRCRQRFDGQREMADHVRVEHDRTDVRCLDCGAVVARNRIGSHRKWICSARMEIGA